MIKHFYYVAIFADDKEFHFLTEVNFSEKTWGYDASKQPVKLAKGVAEDIADALYMNAVPAFVVRAPFEISGSRFDAAAK